MILPDGVAKKLVKSFSQNEEGIIFELFNPLMNVTVSGIDNVSIDEVPIDKKDIILKFNDMEKNMETIENEGGVKFRVGSTVNVILKNKKINSGDHKLKLSIITKEFGKIDMRIPLRI